MGEGVGNTYVSDSLASDDLQMLEIDEVWSDGGEQGVVHMRIALAVRQSHTFSNRESRKVLTLAYPQMMERLRSVLLIA